MKYIKLFLLSLVLISVQTASSPSFAQELGEAHIYSDLNKDNRALNTKGQCVWSSIQNNARQVGETRLYNLTRDRRCQGGASPSDVLRVLPTFGVKWEQAYGSREKCYELIRKAMSLGCPVSVSYGRAHVLSLVHWDFFANKAIIVNNHGDRFQNKLLSIEEFDKNFKGWVIVIFPPDEAEEKLNNFILKQRKIDLDYYAPEGKRNDADTF